MSFSVFMHLDMQDTGTLVAFKEASKQACRPTTMASVGLVASRCMEDARLPDAATQDRLACAACGQPPVLYKQVGSVIPN